MSNKKMYMWLSVIGITLIIGSIWLALVKYNISASISSFSSTKNEGLESLSNIGEKFKKQLQEAKELFKEPAATSTQKMTTTTIKAATSIE